MWAAFVAPLSLAAGVVGLALLLRKQRAMLANGRAAQGRIISYKRYRTQNSSGYRVIYEFRLLGGGTQQVRLNTSRKPPEPGTTVTILYDPDVPKRAVLYPMSLVRVDTEFGV